MSSEMLYFILGVVVTLIITGIQWYISTMDSHTQRLAEFMRKPRELFLRLQEQLSRGASAQQLLSTAQDAVTAFDAMVKAYKAEFPKSGVIHGLYWNIWASMSGTLKRLYGESDSAVTNAKLEMLVQMGLSTLEKVPTLADITNADI